MANSPDFRGFLSAIGRHWVALMSGGAAIVGLGLSERFSGKNVPLWLYACVIVGFVVVASYLAWRDAETKAQTNLEKVKQLTTPKLVFEIDERTTRVYLYEPQSKIERLAIAAKIKLRFENRDTHPISMKRLNVTLHKLVPEQEAKETFTTITFMYRSNGVQIKEEDFEGMMIQERRLTPFYLVEAVMVIDDDKIETGDLITEPYFLRLTMDAGEYQTPFSGDLFLSWKHALRETGTDLTITFNAPAIRVDHRRL